MPTADENSRLMVIMAIDYTFLIVGIGAAILGLVSGCLGCFALLNRQSLLGDAISHATLPGICMAFLLTGQKNLIILLIGALCSGWLGAILVVVITRYTRLKQDVALGIILSVFFGCGLVLLTLIQKTGMANQAGLGTFLFGSASTMLRSDIIVMGGIGSLILVTLALYFRSFKVMIFDADFAACLGLPVDRLRVVLATLLVGTIVIGLQLAGVVLTSALVVAPAAAARQWTSKLGVMVGLGGFFGIISSLSGVGISSLFSQLPTGPVIVLCMGIIVAISLVFAPHRGLFYTTFRQKKTTKPC